METDDYASRGELTAVFLRPTPVTSGGAGRWRIEEGRGREGGAWGGG